jgi:hypothetical protein
MTLKVWRWHRPSAETRRRVRRTVSQAARAALTAGLFLALVRRDPMAVAEALAAGGTVVAFAFLDNWADDQKAADPNRTDPRTPPDPDPAPPPEGD